ncbi:hypothetical protein DOTSEDRAFT_68803 [Dothistroma septosporum NZE10]|uniref:Zn(2)-C6 fungal-type domain-containing protein n=1 Tax=Dothistroma septosporum (strain NZE10 / CBS 128990) TaxID=675120 RepID=N1Q2U3_DOTSN|nr:hypothetical protein DOTSEDRAFT_68803 [Dothistroma septosporum NZE10]
MPGSREESPGDRYFNDLAQQPTDPPRASEAHERRMSQEENNGQVPKPKRIACVLCRKRKLKCDGSKPSCGTCTRLQHDCSYDEVRRKSGPKRGYVKALEARLAQVETLLKTQDDHQPSNNVQTNAPTANMVPQYGNLDVGGNMGSPAHSNMPQHGFSTQSAEVQDMLGAASDLDMDGSPEEPIPWEMIGLGLDEPLPTQDVVDDLNRIYFEKVHPSLPMIHRPRYYAAMNLAPHMRPPVCLRYAMWCNAAVVSDKYEGLQEHFYQRARKYIQQDEMKGHGEGMITVAHCQAWALIATHEFKLMYFPRAWASSGRACRLAQAMGLHRLDGAGLDVKQCIPPPKDWTEREERRRTFWMAFCVDRYSSIGTGWPMTIEERDILTNLPTDEDAYEFSKPAKTMTLPDALEPSGLSSLSGGFQGVILMACLFGRNLLHLHRPAPNDNDDDLNGEFWKRHRDLDNVLLNIALGLPEALRLPSGLNNPNVVFLNMNIHTSTICLHQAAIFKADKNRMPSRISAESKIRCITAAAEIASMMRQISHLDLATMNPFISFCLYVAARVFVQYLKSRPKDAQVKSSLQFLLSALHVIKKKNPLTESFLVQLDVDLEGANLEDSRALRLQFHRSTPVRNKMPSCPQEHLGMPPVYGDEGMASYNLPNKKPMDSSEGNAQSRSFAGRTGESTNDFSTYEQSSTGYSMNMPIRTPGSLNSNSCPGPYESPVLVGPVMDLSPDGSNNDQTPGSSTQSYHHQNSSHTSSNTGHSPQSQNQGNGRTNGNTQDDQLAAIFEPNSAMFTSDFEMQTSVPLSNGNTQQSGFVLPQQWSGYNDGITSGMSSGTGLTPESSGANGMLNGFAGNGVNEMMSGMTDQDWNSVLESFTGWDSGLEHQRTMQESMNSVPRRI